MIENFDSALIHPASIISNKTYSSEFIIFLLLVFGILLIFLKFIQNYQENQIN